MYLFGSPVTSRCILDKFITNYEWTPVATAANKRQLHATDTAGKRIPFQLPGQEMHRKLFFLFFSLLPLNLGQAIKKKKLAKRSYLTTLLAAKCCGDLSFSFLFF